jgi:putative transposase
LDPPFSPRGGWVIIMMEAATMPTVCLRFRFEEHPRIRALTEACADIQRQAIDYALENGKTATFTIIQALYPSLRAQHPDLHANLIYGAIRSGARIVHGFRNQQRKGKTQADRPEIRRPSVYLTKQAVKIEWDGELLTVTIPVSPRDPEPIILTFRPHHKYRRLLDEWKAGRARMGEPTLTAHSLSIPLKFPDPIPYKPEGVIGIDSNEGNLTAFVTSTGEIREIDTGYVGKINRDHLRREIKGTRGKHNPKAKKKIASKHRRIRREKTENFWHHLALALIAWALGMRAALVLEDLKGMKERIGEGKSRRMRQRLLNFWSIMTFHRILVHKARFYGVPVIWVDPQNTSRACPVCGRVGERLRGPVRACPCGARMGRHEAAAVNIARRGVEFLEGLGLRGRGRWATPVAGPLALG